MADTRMAPPKKGLNRLERAMRLGISCLDPRVYLHGFRLLNYYNYTHITPRRRMQIGRDVALSPTISLSNGERISIGDRTHIGAHTTLWAGPSQGRIEIGQDCLLAPGVFITAANYRFRDGAPVTQQAMQEADIRIGNDVWIGANAMILPGALIEDSAIIGAGAIVTGHVPAGAVVANPSSRVIGTRFPNEVAA